MKKSPLLPSSLPFSPHSVNKTHHLVPLLSYTPTLSHPLSTLTLSHPLSTLSHPCHIPSPLSHPLSTLPVHLLTSLLHPPSLPSSQWLWGWWLGGQLRPLLGRRWLFYWLPFVSSKWLRRLWRGRILLKVSYILR